MACSYYPRRIDREIIDVLERRQRGVLLGVEESGAAALVKRAASIAKVPFGDGDCNEYRAVEVPIGEVESAVRCNRFVASIGSLEEVLRALDRVSALVVPPMSTSELEEYLASYGQYVDKRHLEEFLYRTGGYPDAVCKALEELNFPGKIGEEHLEKLPRHPKWFAEFVEKYSRRFLRDAVLGYLEKEEAEALGVRRELWHEEREGRLALKLPWLQFYAIHYDPDYAVSVLREAVEVVKDPARLLYYYALLWKLGVDDYVEKSAELVRHIYDLPPPAVIDLLNYFLEVAPRVGKAVEARAIHAASIAMRSLEFRVEDVIYLAQRAARLAPVSEAYDAIYNFGVLLLTAGKLRETDAVFSTLEDMLLRAKNDEEWLRAKRVLHLLLALKEALLGNWKEVARLLEDEATTLKFLPDYAEVVRRNLGLAYIMLGRFVDAREILRGTSGFQRWALALLKARNLAKLREKARRRGQLLIAALAGLALGEDVEEELNALEIRPEMRELLKQLLRPDAKSLASIASRLDPMDRLYLYYYAVEAYVMLATGQASEGEVKDFMRRLREVVREAGIPGAAAYVKPTRRELARLAVFFL
ncbi:hypothetical protein [Pyrobaculum sp.]|uniref:hypothetical protein n=1 Tax=Pyrobaculum sp. TaxID=2004705 RepID=UPI0031807570